MNALAKMEDVSAPEQERQRYRITDLQSLSWAFRKLAAIEQKKAEINALCDEEVQRINHYREKEISSLDHNAEFFRSLINEYAAEQRASDPDFKKVSTPYGTLKFRKMPAKWNYDDAKLLESLKSSGLTDLIRVKEEPDKATLKKRAVVQDGQVIDPETGSIIEGVTVEEQPEKLELEVQA